MIPMLYSYYMVQRTKRMACCYEVRALSIYIYGLKILNMQMSLYTQRCICKLREGCLRSSIDFGML